MCLDKVVTEWGYQISWDLFGGKNGVILCGKPHAIVDHPQPRSDWDDLYK